MANAKSDPSVSIHDSDSHTRFDKADAAAQERILSLEKDVSSIKASMIAIKWLFGCCLGVLMAIFGGGIGWAFSMQQFASSIQRDVAVQAANSQNQEEGRRKLEQAIIELNRSVQDLRLKVE